MPGAVVDREIIRYTLGERNFRLLWGDSVAAGFGMSGEHVVLSLLVYQATGSSVWVGVTLALYFVPSLLVGALAGAIADWMDRRALVRRCQLAFAIIMAVFAVLLLSGTVALAALLTIALITGVLNALYSPSRLSYAYDLVGPSRAVGGLSVLNLGFRIGQLGGALAAGYLAQQLGPSTAFFALAIGYAVGFMLLRRLGAGSGSMAPDRAPLGKNIRALGTELGRNRTLLMLVLVMISVGVLGFSYLTVLPELATRELGAGARELGLMHAARASGGLLGVGVLAALGVSHHRGLLLLGVILGFGAGLVALGSSTSLTAIVTALVLTAAVTAVYDVLTQSVLQVIVPDRLRGRAMGIWVLVVGTEPAGHVLLGATASILGVQLALQINGCLLVLIALLVLWTAPRLRRI